MPMKTNTIFSEGLCQHFCARMRSFLDEVRMTKPDHLIFLDRSARPCAWMFEDVWKIMCPSETPPAISFLNIGREKISGDFFGRYASEGEIRRFYDRMSRNEKLINRVRDIYRIGESADTRLDGAFVWIVDEYSAEGGSIMYAEALLQAAFPGVITKKVVVLSQEPTWLGNEDLLGVCERSERDLLVEVLDSPHPSHVEFREEVRWLAHMTAD